VICPAIAKINWRREFERWGTVERTVLVYSYDKLVQSKETRNEIAKLEPDVLVIDEAHYLKNRTAKRTKYLYGQYCRGDGLVRFADRVWLLSGTPIPNNVSDFWTHLKSIWKYPLNFTEFTTYFCKTWNGQFGLQILGNKTERMAEFKTVLKSIMLRRKGEIVAAHLVAGCAGRSR
jgi:SNF2 family DNA or RNA helicase